MPPLLTDSLDNNWETADFASNGLTMRICSLRGHLGPITTSMCMYCYYYHNLHKHDVYASDIFRSVIVPSERRCASVRHLERVLTAAATELNGHGATPEEESPLLRSPTLPARQLVK